MRRVRSSVAAFVLLAVLTLSGAMTTLACGTAPLGATEFAPPTIALPGPPDAPPLPPTSEPPTTVEGVATDGLSDREHATWWSAVNELYAPCPDQAVSIAQCVRENRPCRACLPAANMLVGLVKAGAPQANLTAAYGLRFGPDVKKVDEDDSPAQGPADAPVHIVVWHDFECPACRDAMPFLERALRSFPGKVRLVHKFYPLSAHPHAEPAARAAIAADAQGRYWEMEAMLFDRQHALESSDIDGYAQALKLDMAKFRRDMNSQRASDLLERDKKAADQHGLAGTPFILINGRSFDFAYFQPTSDLEPWIATELDLLAAAPLSRSVGEPAQIVTPSGESLEAGGGVTTRRPSTDTSSK